MWLSRDLLPRASNIKPAAAQAYHEDASLELNDKSHTVWYLKLAW
jgi:hypothetical protein